jgi:4-amino-4-deoxy-L-arabinose transferase-like glycosyltransferase
MALAAFFVGVVLLAFVGQGTRVLWEPDEGRYVTVAVQMLRTGDWITPHLSAELPHFTKPPLTYWAIAASMRVLGQSEFAARLPNAIAFVMVAWIVVALAHFLAPGSGLTAGIVWATSFFAFVAANVVTTDVLLMAAESAAVLAFVASWQTGRRTFLIAMWAAFGVGFLVKGPPALIPLLAIAVFVVITRAAPRPPFLSGIGVLLFIVIALSWFAVAAWSRPDVIPYLIGREVVDRATTSVHGRNGGIFGWLKVYVPVAVVGMLPWSAILLWRRTSVVRRDIANRFLLLWLLVPMSLFVVMPSRLPLYILPLTVPAALLIARRLPRDILATQRSRLLLAAWGLCLITLKVGAGFYPSPHAVKPMAEWIRDSLRRTPEEIHFIGAKPEYGLTFYLASDIEEVELGDRVDPTPAYRPLSETLHDEVVEDGPEDAYVVTLPMHRQFEDELRALGYHARMIARSGRFILYSDVVPVG